MLAYKYTLILFIALLCSCAQRKATEVVERYPNKVIKTHQKLVTYKVCKENCRIVKSKKLREEYYETGKLKSIEETVTETTLDGQLRTAKNFSKFFDENGRITKKVNRDDNEGRTYLYENGKLIAKTSFAQ